MTTLYSEQKITSAETLAHLENDRRVILCAPTGSGKTVMAAEIAAQFKRVLFVAHRREIVSQADAAMPENVLCVTVMEALNHGPSRVDLLIIDEAHRSAAPTYRKLIRRYKAAALLGLTATPKRIDGAGLDDLYDEIVIHGSVGDLVSRGRLVPYRALEPSAEAMRALKKLKRIRKQAGDYRTKELSALVNTPRLVSDVVREYQKHATGLKTIVFAVSVKHSQKLTTAFRKSGIRAAHLDGTSPERVRSAALADLAAGRIDVLCNVNLFTEGWDCPPVACVIMARPTCSVTLYLQSIGRGMRPAPGKTELLILDHAGNIERHGAPDAIREWYLESDAKRAAVLKEIAELERIKALGFDSLEEYELEQKAQRDSVYSASHVKTEISRALGAKCSCVILSHVNIFPLRRGGGGGTYYLRTDIDAFLRAVQESYSAATCCDLLGISKSMLSAFLKARQIAPVLTGLRRRYRRSDIDALVANRAATRQLLDIAYTSRDVMAITGRTREVLLDLRSVGISPVRKDGREYLWLKSDIDDFARRSSACV